MLLNDWDFFRRHLDPKIAARDHHAIRDFQNRFQLIEGLRFFQLGYHRNMLLMRGDYCFDLADIVC